MLLCVAGFDGGTYVFTVYLNHIVFNHYLMGFQIEGICQLLTYLHFVQVRR